jgi:hypothetical protein
MAVAPHIDGIVPQRGRQGTQLRCVVTGTGLGRRLRLRFSGAGVTARQMGRAEGWRAEFMVLVAADAPPGPRGVVIGSEAWQGVLFWVITDAAYGGDRGIGSHLI